MKYAIVDVPSGSEIIGNPTIKLWDNSKHTQTEIQLVFKDFPKRATIHGIDDAYGYGWNDCLYNLEGE